MVKKDKLISAIKCKRRTFIIQSHKILRSKNMIVFNDKVFDRYPFNKIKKEEFNKRLG